MKSLTYFYLPIILAWFIQPSVIFAQDDWTILSPAMSPPQTGFHNVAYIGDDKVVLFGGYDGITEGLDQTWVYDLSDNTWTSKNPAVKPPGRISPAIAYIGGDKVVITGGFSGGINLPQTSYSDTWIYDLSDNTWTNMNPPASPGFTYAPSMDYVGGDKVVFLPSNGSETWIYDLSDNVWNLILTPPAPYAFNGDQVASIGGDKIFLLSFNGLPQTWTYDVSDNAWTLHSPISSPNPRYYPVTAYLGGDRVLLYGGIDPVLGFYMSDSWIYDLSEDSWTLLATSNSPGEMIGMGGDRIVDNKIIFYDIAGNTWLFTGSVSPCDQEVCDNGKVLICHINPGNSSPNTLCVAPSAVQGHLNHGDHLGACDCGGSGSQYAAAPPPNHFEQDIAHFAEVHQDDNIDDAISVFPNPADESFEIQVPSNQRVEIRLADPSGKVLQSLDGINEKFEFETSALRNGIYLIQILSAESIITKQIVILH